MKKICIIALLLSLSVSVHAAGKNREAAYVNTARVTEALKLLNESASLFEAGKKEEYQKKHSRAVAILKEEFKTGRYFTVKPDCPFIKGRDMSYDNFYLSCLPYEDETGGLVFFVNKTFRWIKKKFYRMENGESFTAVIRITTSGLGRLGKSVRPWVVLENKSRIEVFCKIVKIIKVEEGPEKAEKNTGEQ